MSALRLSKKRGVTSKAAAFVLMIVFSVPFLGPLIWMVGTALKTPDQVFAYPPVWIPNPVRIQNFVQGWTYASFNRFLVNTLITTLIPLLGEVLVSAMVAYSFARARWPGRDKVFGVCLATMLLPAVATVIPVFVEFRMLHWVDTFLPLIVPALFGNSFYIFLLRQYMLNLPYGLEEAGRIDGANSFQIFVRIILPLVRPGLATVAIFSFMNHWNDFLAPMIYLHRPELKTLTLGLASFDSMMSLSSGVGATGASPHMHLLMAVSCLIALPCVLLFLLFQKYFIRDIVMTGFKM